MVRLIEGQPRPSSTTRRVDLPDRRPARRAADASGPLLRAVLDHGPVARSNLARLTGISTASVTGVARILVGLGLLREVPEAAGPPGFGRPHVPLDLETESLAVLAVHFAVLKATVAVVDLRGRVLVERALPYERPSPEGAVAQVARQVRDLREEYHGRRILGLGVAIGGWVDADAGVVVENALLGWCDVPLRELLTRATGLPAYVENHGRALVRAEQLFGAHAARARESIVHLFVGNVVDAAFSFRGRVHQGRRSAAGNLAHLPVDVASDAADPCACGRRSCFQAAVSERLLLRRAADLGVRARYVDELAGMADDDRVVELFVERARVVGRAAAALVDLFNPEVLTVMEHGFMRVPTAREALFAEVEARSEIVGDPSAVVVPSSFASVLSVAGASVLLDRVFAAPLAVMAPLSTAS
jgi:predicted NBD/HSP70 family sugar kinase